MSNVPIAGVSYHHDGLPKPMSVHCLGQNFNKAPVQRFATRAVANMNGGPNNMAPQQQQQQQQPIRYIGVQPCVQHLHPSQQQQYVVSNNMPRKYVNVNGGMINQQNMRWGMSENGPAAPGPSPANMNGNYQYEMVTNNCGPGGMHQNATPGNITAYRTSNATNSSAVYQQNGNNGPNAPGERVQQNVGFDVNGNLLVNHNRANSIVTFNNGQLKINDGQLTLNNGQIIFNGGHIGMNPSAGGNNSGGTNVEHKMSHQQMMDLRFGHNMVNADIPIRGNIRVENQVKQGQMGNMPPYQINTKVEGQYSSIISPYAGQLNMNTSRYKLTHLPLQKVKTQIIQNNTVQHANMMKTESNLVEQKPNAMMMSYPHQQQPPTNNIDEQQLSGQSSDPDDERIYPRRSTHEVKYDDEKQHIHNTLYSPTYEPLQYKTENNFNNIKKPPLYNNSSSFRPTATTAKETAVKPWLDQSDLGDTLKKVRPVWFKGELNPIKVEQDTYAMDSKKRKIESNNYENENNFKISNRYNDISDQSTNVKHMYNIEPVSKIYRKDCSVEMDNQHSGTRASCELNKKTDIKMRPSIPHMDFPVKVKEEEIDTTEKSFSHSFAYKNGALSPMNQTKKGFYEQLVPPQNNNPGNNTLSHHDNHNGGMKCSLDTPKISRTFFKEPSPPKMESGIDYLDEPPPLIKVEIF